MVRRHPLIATLIALVILFAIVSFLVQSQVGP
jgi:hypothetical protein